MAYTDSTKAALGEKVPALPPDSFQATSASAPPLSETKMPRSWFWPDCEVHRSALALSRVDWLTVGEAVSRSLAASISCQVLPSLLASVYWLVETALWVVGNVGLTVP